MQREENLKRMLALLSGMGDHVYCLVEGEAPLNSPFLYLSGHLAEFSLPKGLTPRALLALLDPHSDLSEGIGAEVFQSQVLERIANFHDPYQSFFLPLTHQGEKIFLLCEVLHDPVSPTTYFSFYRVKGEEGLLPLGSAFSSTYKDSLTGLFNLRTCYEHLRNCQRPIYFSLFDLNHFKTANDAYGHAFGDRLLKSIADYLISIATENEIFYRRSGDEFLINIQNDDHGYALSLIQRIEDYLESLAENEFSAYPGVCASAAFGLIHVPLKEPSFYQKHYSDITKLADLAMYEAKKKGIRMVELSEEQCASLLSSGDLEKKIDSLFQREDRF